MKKQLVIVGIIVLLVAVGLRIYMATTTDSHKEKIIGMWEDDKGDIWTFKPDGGLNISGKNFTFQYWFDEDGFLWCAIKGDDYLHAKYSITFEGHDKMTHVYLGALIGGVYQDTKDPKTIVFTRIE